MKTSTLIASAVLAATASAYTEITQWTGLNCGRSGSRTSYRWIDGAGVYINRDNYAQSVYVEYYDASPYTYFYSGYNGGGRATSGLREGFCYVWDNQGAYSVAHPYFGVKRRENDVAAMVEGGDVVEDDEHRGLGGAFAEELGQAVEDVEEEVVTELGL